MMLFVNVAGLVIMIIAFFYTMGALRTATYSEFELAVYLSGLILSGFAALSLVAVLLVRLANAILPHSAPPPSNEPPLPPLSAPGTSRLPQSEFARSWSRRKATTYEESCQRRRLLGRQVGDRLIYQPPRVDETRRPGDAYSSFRTMRR
jgi:hypothetical protein